MSEIVPFPLARRRGLILRQAAWYAEQSRTGAETNLERQIEVQRAALLKRGIPGEIVERECAELEAAIRAVVRRFGVASHG